jgi:hypothetical protein
MSNPNNPLKRHFRQPAIYLKLPSAGKFYPADALDMPANSELPVLPMTAVDEIIARTPDALFNGSAVIEIIKSCVPNIKDAWSIPAIDLNAILVAVRLASYGHTMEISSTCPACGNVHEFEIDLRIVMDSLGQPDYDTPLAISDMLIKFRPMSYHEANENNQKQFEDQKRIQSINTADIDNQQRIKMLGDSFRNITALTVHAISLGIENIVTPDGTATTTEFIEEFLLNCEKAVFEKIRDHAIKLRAYAEIKPLNIKCVNCEHEYLQEFSLDMSNFFVTNS